MKRHYLKPPNPIIPQELIARTSFHEAGHAVAIYLYNRQRHLPPVYFSIKINSPELAPTNGAAARIEGGRLIQSPSLRRGDFRFDAHSKERLNNDYLAAFEADIVNLLCGPVAEAKYVALNDGEEFNAQLLNLSALNNYGGASDLKKINDYMNSYFDCKPQKNTKLAELFQLACEFVNQASTWRAIARLAQYIQDNPEQSIECEEAIAVINRSQSHTQIR
jgi:hypothetical protein